LALEAAWTILKRHSPTNSALHERAAGIAARLRSRVTAITLARKLADTLHALWRDGTNFETQHLNVERIAA
jgi:hypothetical protein